MGIASLPNPSSATLAKAPLEQVIWQVRHEPKLWDVGEVIRVRDRLQQGYPTIEQAGMAELTLGPSGQSVTTDTKAGWRLRSQDLSWTLVVMPEFIAVECTGYTTWTDFRARAMDFATVAIEALNPALLQRVGLRYVDRLVRKNTRRPGEWRELVSPAILGFGSDELVSDEVQAVQTLNQFESEAGLSATLRTSCATDSVASGYSMLIDTDCYDARARAFDLTNVLTVTDDLHLLNLRLFQRCLGAEYLSELSNDS